ncbi:MAG: hypothetical protein WKH68_07665 [Candidatus Limnocylindria bacterium]
MLAAVARKVAARDLVGRAALHDHSGLAATARLSDLIGPDQRAGIERRLAGSREAGNQQLDDVGIDLDPIRLQRRRNSVVAIHHVVVISNLHQLDRRQYGELIHGARDALPAAAPVLAAQTRQRQEIGGVLRRMARGPHDPVQRDAAQPYAAPRRGAGSGVIVEQRRQRFPLDTAPAACIATQSTQAVTAPGNDGREDDQRGETPRLAANEIQDLMHDAIH